MSNIDEVEGISKELCEFEATTNLLLSLEKRDEFFIGSKLQSSFSL